MHDRQIHQNDAMNDNNYQSIFELCQPLLLKIYHKLDIYISAKNP